MFELVQLTERCYYIESPAKIGLYRLSDDFVDERDDGGVLVGGGRGVDVLLLLVAEGVLRSVGVA